jgi:hypothetical protein
MTAMTAMTSVSEPQGGVGASAWQPAADRFTRQEYPPVGRSGLRLGRIALGLWHNFGAADDEAQRPARCCARAIDHGIIAPRPRQQLRSAARLGRRVPAGTPCCAATSNRPARRADHFSTKAGYTMGAGPARRLAAARKYLIDQPGPEPEAAWGSTTSTSSITTGPDPEHAARGDHGRAGAPCGAAAGARSTSACPTTRPPRLRRGRRAAAPARHALRHPPAALPACSTAASGGRAPARRWPIEGIGCIAVLAAGPGPPHRPLPARARFPPTRAPRARAAFLQAPSMLDEPNAFDAGPARCTTIAAARGQPLAAHGAGAGCLQRHGRR